MRHILEKLSKTNTNTSGIITVAGGIFYLIVRYSYKIKSPPGGMRTAAYEVDVAVRPSQARVLQAKFFFTS